MHPNACATVAIQGQPCEGNPSGIVVINESDFDPATMTKVAESDLANEAAAKAAEVDAAAEAAKLAEAAANPEPPAKIVAPWAAQ